MNGPHQRVDVFRVACRGPGDLSGVQALVDAGTLRPQDIVAVMGKTEGNGCVNDFTREYASSAWCAWLAKHLGIAPDEAERRVALVMSGGTEGVLSPHFTIFTRQPAPPAGYGPRLVIGQARTRDFTPDEIGRRPQIEATAQAVREAMRDAGISDAAEVHFVQIKCPLLSSAALTRAVNPVTHDTYESMGWSRGASALGVALALGEVEPDEVTDAAVLRRWDLHASRASASAGIELDGNVVIVLGQAEGSASPHRIGHTLMHDAIDAQGVAGLLRAMDATPETLVNLLAKAEASPDGRVRDQRHTMLQDSDLHATRHARAAVGAVLASLAGHTALYVSGGAEHQGPPGGGPVAAIVRVEP
jgi:cyanuric acid amidohydrolase